MILQLEQRKLNALIYRIILLMISEKVCNWPSQHIFISHSVTVLIYSILIYLDVLGNLTSLEVLDLSYNDLDDLNPENYPFQLPDNLTEMYLNNNRLHRLPNDAVHNLTKLNVLDISDNVMGVFNYTLLNKIPSGLKLLVNGELRINLLENYLIN